MPMMTAAVPLVVVVTNLFALRSDTSALGTRLRALAELSRLRRRVQAYRG